MVKIKKSAFVIFFSLFLLIFAFFLIFLSFKSSKTPSFLKKEIQKPSLAKGRQVFKILTNPQKTFKIIKVELNPLNLKKGETQIVKVWIEDKENQPITNKDKVEGIVFTDTKKTSFSFELKRIEDKNGANLLLWQGSWTLKDSYDKIYKIKIKAISAKREHIVDLVLK